ncbi:argininosuccinate lyase [Candidatus Daviesbacteria bacterium]|nr:argininosuccinate lyase [Candidatus Daviesbacteria bacterium]
MKKLWQKDKYELDPDVEAFETEEDLIMDQKLVKYDCLGSLAHAKMLKKIGIISSQELAEIKKGINEILELDNQNKFILEKGEEDVHTKIENYLTDKYGQAGGKIHTARSRNDQVLTAIRLYCNENLEQIEIEIFALIENFQKFSKNYGSILMPGYTHMQKAMPSTIALWTDSFMESLKDDLLVLKTAYKLNNQSPLGSGAGYGAPIELDREYTKNLLGFGKVQQTTYCQNSRGKIEASVVSSLISILQTINKFASDVMLFTTSEFDFFEVSDQVTTGSSIMPQKKNVDIGELLRSKVHLVLGNYTQIVSLSSNLVSGYNRDFQDTKKPLIESFEITQSCLKVTKILLENLIPNKQKLEDSMTAELYQAEKALELVIKGMSFREAYQKIGMEVNKNAK